MSLNINPTTIYSFLAQAKRYVKDVFSFRASSRPVVRGDFEADSYYHYLRQTHNSYVPTRLSPEQLAIKLESLGTWAGKGRLTSSRSWHRQGEVCQCTGIRDIPRKYVYPRLKPEKWQSKKNCVRRMFWTTDQVTVPYRITYSKTTSKTSMRYR